MKNLMFVMICLLTTIYAKAEEPPRLQIGGELFTDQRMFINRENDWAWNENRLNLRLEKRTERMRFFANTWLRHLGVPEIAGSHELQSRDRVNPWNLNIREAYFEVREFLSDDIDLKVGRQIISWGTADYFNPTNMLNPSDLEDALDFGRKNGSLAVNLTWFINPDWSLQGVYIPQFSPANLPVGAFAGIFHSQIELPEGMQLGQYRDVLDMPRNNVSEGATIGLRLKGFVLGADISLSYIFGREHLPFADHVILSPSGEPGKVNIDGNLFFPRYHMAGADFAGTIGNVGVWAEAAMFFPENEVILTADFSQLHGFPPGTPTLSRDSLLMSKKPYMRYIVGADYTFGNGIYLNVQYLHGFFHERGRGNQNDYLLFAAERNFFGDRLLVRPIAGGLAIANWQNPEENHAVFFTPEILFRGIDNLELGLGAYFFGGEGDNIFTKFREMDMLTFSARVSF
ncbi:MAG TPA: DUF1302 family protein [Bacteroidales bacterium]|nr:DUF1302 family protein [Bacteroidales bacterium]